MGKENYINNPQYTQKGSIIQESLDKNIFSLQTLLSMVSDMDEPRALYKINEIIIDKKNKFSDLEKAFKFIEKSWKQGPKKEIRRRALISFFQRSDCPPAFRDKYAGEVFPDMIKDVKQKPIE